MHNGARIPIHQVFSFSGNFITFVVTDVYHVVFSCCS